MLEFDGISSNPVPIPLIESESLIKFMLEVKDGW